MEEAMRNVQVAVENLFVASQQLLVENEHLREQLAFVQRVDMAMKELENINKRPRVENF